MRNKKRQCHENAQMHLPFNFTFPFDLGWAMVNKDICFVLKLIQMSGSAEVGAKKLRCTETFGIPQLRSCHGRGRAAQAFRQDEGILGSIDVLMSRSYGSKSLLHSCKVIPNTTVTQRK